MYFYDTYAIIEMILQNPKYIPYSGFTITVSPLNLGELYIFLARTYGEETALKKYSGYSFSVIELTKEIMLHAARFKLAFPKKKYSWADSAGYVAALKRGMKFLTGDSQFKNMENVEFVASNN